MCKVRQHQVLFLNICELKRGSFQIRCRDTGVIASSSKNVQVLFLNTLIMYELKRSSFQIICMDSETIAISSKKLGSLLVSNYQLMMHQGDGESVPETPPNEQSISNLTQPPETKQAASTFQLKFELDGVATVLLVLGLFTRLIRQTSTQALKSLYLVSCTYSFSSLYI